MKIGDLVKDNLWGGLGVLVCLPPMSSTIEVFWSGENPRVQKHLLGDLEVLPNTDNSKKPGNKLNG